MEFSDFILGDFILVIVALVYIIIGAIQLGNKTSKLEIVIFAMVSAVAILLTVGSILKKKYRLYTIAKVLSLIFVGLNIGYSFQCDEITSYSWWYFVTGILFLLGLSYLDYYIQLPFVYDLSRNVYNMKVLDWYEYKFRSDYKMVKYISLVVSFVLPIIYAIPDVFVIDINCDIVFYAVLISFSVFVAYGMQWSKRSKYSAFVWNFVAIVVVTMSVITNHWTIIVSSVFVYIILVVDHRPLLDYKYEEIISDDGNDPNFVGYQLREMRFNF